MNLFLLHWRGRFPLEETVAAYEFLIQARSIGGPVRFVIVVKGLMVTASRLRSMTAFVSHTSFDSVDAYAQSVFWAKVLDFVEDPEDPNRPGDEECGISSKDGTQHLLFIEVSDTKQVKNRLHLDLRPVEGTRDQELERLLSLGARQVDDRRELDGTGWVVLADPDGNEFCILRSNAECRHPTTP